MLISAAGDYLKVIISVQDPSTVKEVPRQSNDEDFEGVPQYRTFARMSNHTQSVRTKVWRTVMLFYA